MEIYIRGMEMPKRGKSCLVITITPDGEIYKNVYDASLRVNQIGEAIPVPPHGDLIDRDALPTSRVEWEDIINAPAIIPAEEGK